MPFIVHYPRRYYNERNGALDLFICNPFHQGTIIDDTMIMRNADNLFVVVNAGCADKDWAHLQANLSQWQKKGKDVVINRVSEARSLLALQGPESAQVLAQSMGSKGPEIIKAQPFLSHFHATVFGKPAVVSRCGYSGEDGFEISILHQDAVHVADSLLASPSVRPIGLGARDTLRLEAGLCLYGNDIDTTTSPAEASLIWTVAKARRRPDHPNKFPGWDRIMREINTKDVSRKRVGLLVTDQRRPPPHPSAVFNKDGLKVGQVTSGTLSPCLEKGIGMAYIDRGHNEIGTQLFLEVRGKKLEVQVSKLPFVETKYYTLKK